MTCQECELLLATEQHSAEADLHLSGCAECRALNAELSANSDALREMVTEAMPSVRSAVLAEVRVRNVRRSVMRWGWALAAATLVIAFGLSRMRAPVVSPPAIAKMPPSVEAPVARPHVQAVAGRPRAGRRLESRRQPERLAPLKVQMFTSDPNVVIYWLVEPKTGSE